MTGPSASETRAHFSAGDGMGYSGGAFAVDSTVVRTTGAQTIAGAKTFSNDAIFNGNLTVNGTQTILNTETLTVDDNLIVLNNNESGTPSADAGIEVPDSLLLRTIKLSSTGTSVEIADNLITLNADATGTPSENVGIIVERGDSTNVQLRWNESDDKWQYTNNGADYKNLIALDSISVTDAGGDGSLSYNNGTGVITYTGPSAAEV